MTTRITSFALLTLAIALLCTGCPRPPRQEPSYHKAPPPRHEAPPPRHEAPPRHDGPKQAHRPDPRPAPGPDNKWHDNDRYKPGKEQHGKAPAQPHRPGNEPHRAGPRHDQQGSDFPHGQAQPPRR